MTKLHIGQSIASFVSGFGIYIDQKNIFNINQTKVNLNVRDEKTVKIL